MCEVPRFLSSEWFDELEATGPGGGQRSGTGHGDGRGDPELVVEVTVVGTPRGAVRYQVVLDREGAYALSREEAFWPPHVELRSDYATMAGIASGGLSVLDAFSLGRVRVCSGSSAVPAHSSRLVALDLMPRALRVTTTF
jgi:hypothetical protein